MATPLKFAFTAAPGAHLGLLQTLDELLGMIPNPIDWWAASAASVTQVSGAVSAWTGAMGRQLVQADATKRPSLSGNALAMSDGNGTPRGVLALGGTQLGPSPSLTVAVRATLDPAALLVDVHYLLGMDTPTIWRLAHRYANNDNYFRLDSGSISISSDVPPGLAGPLDVIISRGPSATVAGEYDVAVHVGNTVATTRLAAVPDLSAFCVGGARISTPDWPGTVSKLGIWKTAATPGEVTTLKRWLAA